MSKKKVVIIGGFLGAGKTSMMHAAAEILKNKGNKVGLITNDQATNLVDTYLLAGYGNVVHEVSGSCFCCNFPGFQEGIDYVINEGQADIILCEPVGSCTDLSATIMQPLKDIYNENYEIAPLTAMVDPTPLKGILDGDEATAYYIMTKQLDESDIILINKTDLLSDTELEDLVSRAKARFTEAKIMCASVKTGEGIEEWLAVATTETASGTHLAEVDYDIYADGEAAYGWFNGTYTFDSVGADEECKEKAKKLLSTLSEEFDKKNAAVGHVKFLLQSSSHQWMGNITGKADTANLRDLKRDSEEIMLTVNARVEMGPKELQDICICAMDEIFGGYKCIGTDIHSLIPGRPNPTYHYENVI